MNGSFQFRQGGSAYVMLYLVVIHENEEVEFLVHYKVVLQLIKAW